MRKITEQEMKLAIKLEIAQPLTLDVVKAMKGKAISTIYFGYNGQNGVDTFIIGEVVTEEKHILSFNPKYINNYEKDSPYNPANILLLLTEEGRNTNIYLHPYNAKFYNNTFTCSDMDRFVDYIDMAAILPEEQTSFIDLRKK